MTIELLTFKELADALKRGRNYVSAMKHAGFREIVPQRYTFDSAVEWLKAHPKFRAYRQYGKRAQTPQKRPTLADLSNSAALAFQRQRKTHEEYASGTACHKV